MLQNAFVNVSNGCLELELRSYSVARSLGRSVDPSNVTRLVTSEWPGVKMRVIKRNKELWVKVMGKAQEVRYAHGVYKDRPCVCNAFFKCTEEGLLEGLIYAKNSRKRYREEGPCPDCVSSDETRLPRKKLKAMGMPKCAECMLTAIVS